LADEPCLGRVRPSNVGLDQEFIHLSSILDLCFITYTIDDPAEYSTAILAALSTAVQAGEHACETATLRTADEDERFVITASAEMFEHSEVVFASSPRSSLTDLPRRQQGRRRSLSPVRSTTPGETTRRSGSLPPDSALPCISPTKGTFRKYPTEDWTNNTQHSICYKKMNSRTRSASFSAVSSGVEEGKDPRRGRSTSVPLDPDHPKSHQSIMHKIDLVKPISNEALDSSTTPDLQLANTNCSRIAPLMDPDQAVTHPEQVEPIEQGVPCDIDGLSSSTEQSTCPILHTQAVTDSSQPALVPSVAIPDLQPPVTSSAIGEVTDPCLISDQPETNPDQIGVDVSVASHTISNASQADQLVTEALPNQEDREDQDEPQMALVPKRFIAETMISPLLLPSPTVTAGERLTTSTTIVASITEEGRSDSFELLHPETIDVPAIFVTSPTISPILAPSARIEVPVHHPSSCTENEEEEQETVTEQAPKFADPVSPREPSIAVNDLTRQLEDTIEPETEPQDQVGPGSEISTAAAMTPLSHIITAGGDGPQKEEENRIAILPASISTPMPSLVQGGSRATSLDPEPGIVDERPIARRRAKSLESFKSSDAAIVPVFVQPVTRPSQPPESTDEEVVAQPVVEHASVISASALTREGNRPRPRARQNKRKKTSRSQSQELRYPRKRIKLIRSASFGVDQQAPIGILASIDDMRRDVDASGTKLNLSLGLEEASVVTTPPPAESQPKVSSSAITTASERGCPEIIEDVSFEEVQAMLTVMKRGKETGTKVETVEKRESPQTPKKRPSSGLSQISVCPLPSCTL
jgi:hypothetical protein